MIQSEELLTLINEAAVVLLTAEQETFEKALSESMEKIAGSLEIDRINIWRADEKDGVPAYVRINGWSLPNKDGTESFEAIPSADIFPFTAEWDSKLLGEQGYISESVDDLTGYLYETMSAGGVKAIMAFPVFFQGAYWGFISYENRHSGRRCTEPEAALLKSGSLLLATAAERNESNLHMNRRLAQQHLMSDISRSFVSNEPVEYLIHDALSRMGEFLDVDRVIIAVFEKTSEKNRAEYCWIPNPKHALNPIQPGFGPVLRQLFPKYHDGDTEYPSIYCDNTLTYQDGRFKLFYERAGIKSFICAPIYLENELWGLMSVEEHEEFRRWSQSNAMLASMVASAISNAVARDHIESERTYALLRALRASRAKGEFLSNMSHEILTPINVIMGMTAIAKSAADFDRVKYCISKIDDATKHLLGIINDVFDISRIEANRMELIPASFKFEKMLRKAVAPIRSRAEERKLKLYVKTGEKIPPSLIGDERRLTQVISNLLTNAVKFTLEGGTITLDSRLISEENNKCRLEISVEDTGIGIPDDLKTRVFEYFEQVEIGRRRKYGGTGLGLAISKRIVDMMGGDIRVESELGRGSKFTFTVVLERDLSEQKDDADDETYSPELDLKYRKPENFAGRNILLAEDLEINREIVFALLESTMIDIDWAENGIETVRVFSENPDKYELILMDIQMPAMDGYEATRRIRALDDPRAKKVPIVALTANTTEEDVRRCLESGMNDHLSKPIELDEVLAKLAKYLH